jgi:hypothetical protein
MVITFSAWRIDSELSVSQRRTRVVPQRPGSDRNLTISLFLEEQFFSDSAHASQWHRQLVNEY